MIGHLKGQIISKNPPEILLEVSGIGYELLCPMSTFYELGNLNDEILLFTHLSIKEDAHTLFGFISKDEKNIFRELIRVNGVGPKVALAILLHLAVPSLIECIANEENREMCLAYQRYNAEYKETSGVAESLKLFFKFLAIFLYFFN